MHMYIVPRIACVNFNGFVGAMRQTRPPQTRPIQCAAVCRRRQSLAPGLYRMPVHVDVCLDGGPAIGERTDLGKRTNEEGETSRHSRLVRGRAGGALSSAPRLFSSFACRCRRLLQQDDGGFKTRRIDRMRWDAMWSIGPDSLLDGVGIEPPKF